MDNIKKLVNYQGEGYLIEYKYEKPRCLDGWTIHDVYIMDQNNMILFNEHWADVSSKQESVIGHVHNAISEYEKLNRKPYSNIDEFANWDGDLNNWDE